MIADWETNTLYVADTLSSKHPEFSLTFENLMKDEGVSVRIIPSTKDIWCRDYMPIQKKEDRFIAFQYQPDYLQSKKWRGTISRVDEITGELGFHCEFSQLIVDGGNIVKSRTKAIVTDKIFKENPGRSKTECLRRLQTELEVEKLIIIPAHPEDFIGHSDGMVRFANEDIVLLNDYAEEKDYHDAILESLIRAGLEVVTVPYNPYQNADDLSAQGIYCNYLQMKSLIVFPFYGRQEDEPALRVMESVFPNQRIVPLDCTGIAIDGGVLNCVTWNILNCPNIELAGNIPYESGR